MKKISFKTKTKGHQKKRTYIIKTVTDTVIGHFNYNLDVFINNKNVINKYLKFNGSISDGMYNSLFYNYKQLQ